MHGSVSRLVRVGIPLLLAAASGCTASPIGDPCVPESIPAGGFAMQEVYLETSSVQCRTRTCMVYQLMGDPNVDCGTAGADPDTCTTVDEREQQIFCSCRCSVLAGASANTPLCNCGQGFTCVDDLVTNGGEGVQGGYCVPCIEPGNPQNLPSPPFLDCPTP